MQHEYDPQYNHLLQIEDKKMHYFNYCTNLYKLSHIIAILYIQQWKKIKRPLQMYQFLWFYCNMNIFVFIP